jgi:TIR domain
MTDVFISYARADRNRVRLIAHALTAEGFSVWWDPEIKPGAQWNAAIRKALENAACVVTCWSNKSVKSQWVVAETTHGNGRQALVPLLIQSCEPPIPFNMMQAADLSDWRGDGSDPTWIAALEEIRRLVEAKRRLIAAGPPPGEAYGAERAATGLGQAAEEAYHYTPAPSRMGPRLMQMLVGGAVATAVLTGGLWLAPQVADRFSPPQTEIAHAPEAPLGPQVPALEGSSVTPDDPDAGAAPAVDPDTPVSSPPAASPTQTTPPAPNPSNGQVQPSQPTPTPPQSADATRDLDACVNRLVAMCPNANGQPQGFAADGRVSNPERTFLDGLQIASATPASQEAAQACQGVITQRAASTRRRTTLFDQTCRTVAFPAPTTQTPTVPREVIETIPEIITPNRDRPNANQSATPTNPTRGQATPDPRTGRFSLRLGQWANFATGETSAASGDIALTQGRSGNYLSSGQTGQVGLPPGGQASLESCRQASFGESLMLGRLQAGSGFCVRRSNGAIVAARVADISAEGIVFSYTAWAAQ